MSILGEKAKARLAKFGRLDLAIADVRRIDNRSVKVAFSFLENLGNPTKTEVDEFFKIHLAEFTPHLDSCYKSKDGVFVLASLKPVTRPVTDTSKMKSVIAGLKFLDADLGSVWELDKNSSGTPVLQQVVHSDVAEMVKERAKRMNRTSAKIEINANVANLAIGDKVLLWHENHKYEGVVQKLNQPKVTVNVAGSPMVLDVHAVYKILEKSPGKEKVDQENITNYYTEVFGPKYARDLTKK